MTEELDIDSDLLRELFHNWRQSDGSLPHQSKIDPTLIPGKLMPFVAIIDVYYGLTIRYRARLVGNGLVHYAGVDYIHKFLDDLSVVDELRDVIAWYDSLIKAPKAAVSNIPFITEKGDELACERLFLPYVNHNNEVTCFMVANILESADGDYTLP